MSQYKRKYDGPPVRELRRVDQDPIRTPPHKKPRKYRLTLEYTVTETIRYTKEFPSKEAMRDCRARMDRLLADELKKKDGKYRYRYSGFPYSLKMDSETVQSIKDSPVIKEEMLEGAFTARDDQ